MTKRYQPSYGTHRDFADKKVYRRSVDPMASVNLAMLMGNVGSDPKLEIRGGVPCALFQIAMNESWRDQNGKAQSRTEWVRIKCWGKLAENAAKGVRRGGSVWVEGKVTTSRYRGSKGDVYVTEIDAHVVKWDTVERQAQDQHGQDPRYAPDLDEQRSFRNRGL